MDRAVLENQLAIAERNVCLGLEHIGRQQRVIEELRRRRRPSSQAEKLLAIFQKIYGIHIEDRDQLIRELAGLD
jgi:hypothetical protein